MGFLKVFGRALLWDESKPHQKTVKDNAVKVIINAIKAEKQCRPQFGYEFEFHKIIIDDQAKKVYLDLSGQDDIIKSSTYNLQTPFHLSHEYGGWMLEVIHDNPFQFNNVSALIGSVNHCYNYLNEKIGKNKYLSFPSFPRLGCGNSYFKEDYFWEEKENPMLCEEKEEDEKEGKKTNDSSSDENHANTITSSKPKEEDAIPEFDEIKSNPFSQSIFINDMIINRHPRFGNLTRNIRLRRGKKVEIKIPIYKDTNTNLSPTPEEPFPGYVYMDAMAFGMGNCCLQVTLGACCVNSATYLYDQYLPFTPILLALSSSCPVYKGKLTDYDNRFDLIVQGVDDRTDDERDPKSKNYIPKSRYSPAYSYISEQKDCHDFYNDYTKFPINKEYYDELVKGGLTEKLSMHFANVLVRDALVIFSEKINITDPKDMTHFETINSSNWNSLRFKLPRPSDNDTCFKIEVRPCDLQLTPYENTSMIALILAIYGFIMRYDVNFIIPISMVDENFNRAYKNDAINKQKFYWRINSVRSLKMQTLGFGKYNSYKEENRDPLTYEEDIKNNIKELTIDEIVNGCERYNYPGIMKLVFDVMKEFYKTNELDEYMQFVARRAKGELWTGAKYVREFIKKSEKYKHDSIISDELNYELIEHLEKIQNGEIKPKEMFGEDM